MLAELKTISSWDIVYIGNDSAVKGAPRFPIKRQITKHLVELSNWEVLHTYLITNRCAHAFLQDAFPIRDAIDVFMGTVFAKHNVLALGMVPSLDWTVPNESDTNRFI